MPMNLEIIIKLKYDENMMELGDFRWEVQDRIKKEIINSIMNQQKTIDFVTRKTEEVLDKPFKELECQKK